MALGARRRRPAPEPATDRPTAADPAADPVSAARTICLNLLTIRARYADHTRIDDTPVEVTP